MKPQFPVAFRLTILSLSLLIPPLEPVRAQGQTVDFASDRWVMKDAQIVDHLGRKALMGTAWLKDVDFTNGVIEVDVAVTGASSYPGFYFRMQSEQDCERIYLRPHRLPQYQDGIQYTPTFNGVSGWQLYNGPGLTAGMRIPTEQWVHMRLEVFGNRARFYLGDATAPSLAIDDLKRGSSNGLIGLNGPKDGSAFFSEFRYTIRDDLAFDPPPPVDFAPGVVSRWEISQSFKLTRLDLAHPAEEQGLPPLEWREVESEPDGLVDISRYVRRPMAEQGEPDCVFARTTIHADKERPFRLRFGYSDLVSVFLNGRPLFMGSSGYRMRDPSFVGAVGLFDELVLPVRKGDNEVVFLVAEQFGGWGFVAADGEAAFESSGLSKLFETAKDFTIPESAVIDPARSAVYVSNYDPFPKPPDPAGQFISRVGLDGKVRDVKWVSGLNKPTGLALAGGKLYAAERTGLVEIDIDAGRVASRIPIPGAQVPNDVATDPSGAVYVTDSRRNAIVRVAEGRAEDWLVSPEIGMPNGICVDGARLIVGCNADGCVKAVDLASKAVSVLAELPRGTIEGIELDGKGNILVSHNEGRIFRVDSAGGFEKLLDLSRREIKCADFDYDPATGLLVIPTTVENRVIGYRVKG